MERNRLNERPKVFITHWIHPEAIAYLSETCEVIANQTRETLPTAEILERAKGADALMVFMPDVVDRAFLDQCKTLKIIAGAFKGYDNIDVDACTRKGVWFTIANDLLTVPTAELAVGLLISLARNIVPGDRLVRSGRFNGWRPVLYGMGLQGRTVGIVGMGKIGRAIAERLAGFTTNTLYSDPVALERKTESALHLERAGLGRLLATSDYVILSLPLSPDSFYLINSTRLGQMKKGSYLINIGRGSVVDEEAVAHALQTGRLAGYAADVFAMEDLSQPDRPLKIFPGLLEDTNRTVFTAHLGSAVDDVRRAIALDAARNIVEGLAGAKPHGAVNNLLSIVCV
jgi:phosphonate dehydrogenase